MKQYLDVLGRVLSEGERVPDRTGTGTIQLFGGTTMTFDMSDGFPLITTKKMAVKNVIRELLWFLSGDTNVRTLQSQGCHIWDKNYEAYEHDMKTHEGIDPQGNLGPIYGKQWRSWSCMTQKRNKGDERYGLSDIRMYVDQIASLVDMIRKDPHSRRLIVSAWNVAELEWMALTPCHVMFQCHVREDKYLDMMMLQRSADMFLGVPFNIASYAFLLHMLAQQTDLIPGRFYHVLSNAHIYLNHIEQVKEQLSRQPYSLPELELRKAKDIFSYTLDDFVLDGYVCHPAIKGDMSV